ncbi:MAG: acyl-CoA dehydrogenase family protein [Dehalococcoidales bacterium]|nr:MAG: acyl-CoA dehydrogenase family protein [Dehalococcoidales bacterium]
MDFHFTPKQEAFRQEVRDFLEEEIKNGTFQPMCDGWIQGYSRDFTKKVAARGWIGLAWPKEYGGQGRSHIDRLILTEEMLRYGAPAACHWFADRQIGNAVMAYGTEELQQEFLPKILKGEAYVGLGMSEPEAGSDLASLQTKAVEDGDDYIITGQKMWTSCAGFMTHVYLVARTDQEAPKHRGISEFIIDATLPGITIQPTIDITGSEAWGEVFYDNVRIPKKYLIGEKNRGFYQILNQLDYERAGLERLMGNYPLFNALIQFTKETERNGVPLCKDPSIRQKLAQLQIEFEAGRLLTYRVVLVIEKGRAPNVEAAMAKAYCTTFEQRLASVATEILGLYGQLLSESKWAPILGMAPHSYLGSKGYSLQAGTTEVLKNIVATRGLGLPTE